MLITHNFRLSGSKKLKQTFGYQKFRLSGFHLAGGKIDYFVAG